MKMAKQAYTLEFKDLAVKRVKDGQALSAVAKELGLVEQTLRNWVKAAAAGTSLSDDSNARTKGFSLSLALVQTISEAPSQPCEVAPNVIAGFGLA